MNIVKNILGRILAFYALILFLILMLIFSIPIWMTGIYPDPRRTKLLLQIARIWMYIFFPLTGLRLRIKGKEYFKKGENYIVTCNHNSFMDVPLTCPFIPGVNKTIAKIELSRLPIFGMIYKRGSVLVDRKSEKSRKESYGKMKEVLKQGMHMTIYPEGTRNKTGNPLKSFHDGAFRLSRETNKPIIPTILFNTRKVLPPEKPFYFRPTRMEMHFLEPVVAGPGDTVDSLREKVFRIMWDYYAAHSGPLGKG